MKLAEHKLILIFIAVVVVIWLKVVMNQYFLFPLLRNNVCSDEHIITVTDGGQLGNNIWEYMSLFAVTHLYNKTLKLVAYCPEVIKTTLEEVFESLTIPGDADMPRYCLNMKKKYTLELNQTIHCDKLLNNNYPVILARWSARYQEVLQYGFHKIKRELRFHKKHVERAREIFDEAETNFGITHHNATFVGMHYRGTDYVKLLNSSYNSFHGLPNYKFYLKTMNYFKRRYKNVIFILITIDYNWLKENLIFLLENNNLIVNPNQQDYIKDLTLLSHCNHSIISYGTFGVTSALFAGGTTFVYDLGIPLDQRGPTVAMGIAKLLPNWHLLKGPR